MSLRPPSLIVLASLAVSGCAAAGIQVKLKDDDLRPTSQFQWVDARPPQLKGDSTESSMVTSCAYGSLRLGDGRFTPDRSQVLRSELERALGTELAGKRVVLKAYTVHLNRSQLLRGRVADMNKPGAMAALLNDQTVRGCNADDLRGGYVASEQKTPHSPVVVVIDLEVGKQLVHTRWFESAPTEINKERAIWNEWMTGTLQRATTKAVENVRASLAAPAA
jgi:hypothetical protein